jgi:hypothetical protein
MKIKTLYVCEICGKDYTNKEEALACEAKGTAADARKLWPVGMIIPSSWPEVVLAVAKVRDFSYNKHLVETTYWAGRSLPVGDSLGAEVCGNDLRSGEGPTDYFSQLPDLTTPHAQRLLAFLKKEGIEPVYWDGQNIIPIPKQQ